MGEGDTIDGPSRVIAERYIFEFIFFKILFIVENRAEPVRAGWRIGRSRPTDLPDTPSDEVDSPFQKITSAIMNSALNSNEKRSAGMGLVGKCFGREYKKGIDKNENVKKQIDEMELYRPYFTYWVCLVQILVL